MDPIIQILNNIIAQKLPLINQTIDRQITNRQLDPWVHVTSGKESPGSIDLGICTATAYAGYEVQNLSGLASFAIGTLQVSNQGANPTNAAEVNGGLTLAGSLGAINTNLSGSVGASCGFLNPSVGLSGNVSASSVQVTGSGSFQATLNGGQICLAAARFDHVTISYSGLSVNIDGLGIFNVFLRPLENLILDQFQNQIADMLARALTPALNDEIASMLPLCASLS
jgi:hypothetical protein